jgi:hypothetical protein
LEGLGFSLVVHVYLPEQVPNVVAILALLENRQANDLAMVVTMHARSEGPVGPETLKTHYVEFGSELVNGSEVATNNSSELPAFAPPPERIVLQMPQLEDLARLYRCHELSIDEFGRAARKPLPPSDSLLEALRADMIRELESQVGTGCLYRDTATNTYRATWAGAFVMTWKQLWPVSAVRRFRRRRRAETLLAEWRV